MVFQNRMINKQNRNISDSLSPTTFGHAWIALCLIPFLPKEFLLLQDSAQISPFQLHKERQSPVSLFS